MMSLSVLIKVFVIFVANAMAQKEEVDPKIQDTIRALQCRHKCTRRFTPGVCLEQVTSVWSFEFQIMNCTERLGCPASHRTNRFSDYRTCISRCQPLVDLYLQILAYGGDNDTKFFLRESSNLHIRRDGSSHPSHAHPSPAPEDAEYSGDETILARAMYGDMEDTVDNVDHVDRAATVRDQYD